MEQVDKQKWLQVSQEIKGKIKEHQFKLLCQLHAKYFNHQYFEPCGCKPKRIVQWIDELNKLSNE